MDSIVATDLQSNFFVRCWKGQAKLWQAFWLVAVLGKVLVLGASALLPSLLWHGPQDSVFVNAFVNMFVTILLGAVQLIHLIFASVSVWRCAPNAKTTALGGLARVWVVLSLVLWATAISRAL